MDNQVYEQKINDQRFLIETLKAVNKKVKAENERLEKWQIKPTEAICLTDLSCRYKKVFKSD